jgi:hypothetical protein
MARLAISLSSAIGFVGLTSASAATIEEIRWTTDNLGRTLVVVTSSQPIGPGSYRVSRVENPPRAVVAIAGITSPFVPSTLAVDDRNTYRMRIGHHPETSPPELHVVFDLTDKTVEVIELRHRENRLDIFLGLPDEPAPTSTPSATVAPSPWLTATPRPSPTRSATSTPLPSYPDRPAPPVLPTAGVRVTTPTDRADDAGTRSVSLATPTPGDDAPTAAHVIDLAASARGDGTTLLRITADGVLPEGCARFFEVADDPPRIVVTIRNVSAPGLDRSIDIDDPLLERIRLVHDAEVSLGELHLVLHLTDPEVSVTELKQLGPHLVLQLARP